MRRIALLFVLPMLALACAKPVAAPVAERRAHVIETHGDRRVDDYYWLRDREDPAVIAYLNAENAYTERMTRRLAPLRETLGEEFNARLADDNAGVPYQMGQWMYRWRESLDVDYRRYYRAPVGGGEEQLILDLNEIAEGKSYVDLGGYEVSDDGHLLAYTIDFTGGLDYTLFVKDLRTGKLVGEPIEQVSDFSVVGNDAIYCTLFDSAKRPHRVIRRGLSARNDTIEIVYEDPDREFNVGQYLTRSDRFIVITTSSFDASEVRVIDLKSQPLTPRLILPRRAAHQYYVDHHGEHFLISTNDAGRNFRLVRAPIDDPQESKWEELIAHRRDAMIEGVEPFARFIAVQVRFDAKPMLRILDAADPTQSHDVGFDEPSYGAWIDANEVFDTDKLRLVYESMVTPSSVYDYDTRDRSLTLLKRTPVIGYEPSDYVQRRLFATASDGTRVPVSIVHRRDLPTGPRPVVLWGYGSYGAPEWPWFDSSVLSFLDRGGIYAIAQLRGGGDYGQYWADDGKLNNKLNTFTDFIAVAEHLIAEKLTAPDRLLIHGASAGGLLVGAVCNMRPDLFKAAVLEVPFVDVLTTMLDDTLPLTTQEYTQWGNPNEREAYFYMKRYSPYDNIERKAYPSMFVKTSLNDNQVLFHEPAKFVAKMRAMRTDDRGILFKCDMDSGHGGASGRSASIDEAAFLWSWMFDQLGLTK